MAKLNETINTQCNDKLSCTIRLTNDDIYSSEYLEESYRSVDALNSNNDQEKIFNDGNCGSNAAFYI